MLDTEQSTHCPVLLNAVLQALQPQQGGVFVDCTLGLGGHSEALLAASTEVRVIGIDQDEQALTLAKQRLACFGQRLKVIHANFAQLTNILAEQEFAAFPIRGILADLGISSMQLAVAERGFSFQLAGSLDMRMDQQRTSTAAMLVNSLKEEELANLIYQYGEEPASRAIARAIVRARKDRPIESTLALADLIAKSVGMRNKHKKSYIHPATRTFQALRIAVNQELEVIKPFIESAVQALAKGGRLAVISFHSLEDRIVKNAYRFAAGQCRCPVNLPQCVCGTQANVRILTKKPIIADEQELNNNPRARSAKLRVCEKISEMVSY